MKPFLYQIAARFYSEYEAAISQWAFVFPNRRAGLFFKKYLSEVSGKPLFSPTILTINDLFMQLSGKRLADPIGLLALLYTIYIQRSGSEETFDEFLYWGEMLLNDFNDIDKYMVDARLLFTNVTDLHSIENDFSFLNEHQIAAIRSFWSSFYPKNDSPNRQSFLSVWQILYDLYKELRETLAAKGQGYEGMIFREVTERLLQGGDCELPYTVVFVGLNALSPVEDKLLSHLQSKGKADFYWDYASGKVTDKDNKASFFVERNKKRFPSRFPLPEAETLPPATIEVIGIPSGVGQAKQVYNILQDICRKEDLGDEEALRTAVVLPDERLLIPVLNAIPESIRRINVTMGYPLTDAPVASLMEYVLTMQKNIRHTDSQPAFYFRDVLPILNHRYIAAANPITTKLVREITQYNKIYIPSEELRQTDFLTILFTPAEGVGQISDYLIRVLERLGRTIGYPNGEDEEDNNKPLSANDLEKEFIFQYVSTVRRLNEVLRESAVEMKIDTYLRLLKRIIGSIHIPFRGEPLSGLQIMGMLETRALDFDRLIILSMNEGTFPRRQSANSFIPYNLRKGFNLPTYEQQDSIWAYHFYRLIYRASRISLIYDSRNTGLQTGEMSRFIHQLIYHYGEPVRKKIVVYNISSSRAKPICIKKSDRIMDRLALYRKGGGKSLSASAVNMYLDCPLMFYFSMVEGIDEEEEVTETIESRVFGSIFHKVMEKVYHPVCNKPVTADWLEAKGKDKASLRRIIEEAFAEIFFKTETVLPLTGQNYLIGEMIRKYAEKVLEVDAKLLTPFDYIESEKRMKDMITLSDGSSEIPLKGFIDRIDRVGDSVRIIDYKSGGGLSAFQSVKSLFNQEAKEHDKEEKERDKEEKERAKAVMQVFMYAWMYSRLPGNNDVPLQPGIYYLRTLFSGSFDAGVYRRIDRSTKVFVERFSDYASEFEDCLRACLDEIFNKNIPFKQTSGKKSCAWCQFKDICGK
ncbi:MAG: PD-(D/E)XK nuclease family protein [Bacteroidales bacterium]